MKILRANDRPHREKVGGNDIIYGLFPEYEINLNVIEPGVQQDWHYHKEKDEAILVIDGSLDVEEKKDSEIVKHRLDVGDIARVEATPHRFSNGSSKNCRFVCFKTVLTGQNRRDILAGDKIPFNPLEK